jgi:transcriptional regulator with XRE-family HTH domain
MRTRELLLECKVKLKIDTDYALAKALDIPRPRIHDYMNGKRKPDEFACFKIAETLGREPAEIIAEVNAEQGGKHAGYFGDFMQRRVLGVFGGALLLTCSTTYAPESNAANLQTSHNAALRRKRRPITRPLTSPEVRGFFSP